jgi:tRNA-dihydrouridine synthase
LVLAGEIQLDPHKGYLKYLSSRIQRKTMKNFWKNLPKPIFALAPLDEVTDTVFRRVVSSCAKPDVMFTEFTSVEGLTSKGADKVIHRLKYTPEEHPLIAQIWGKDLEAFTEVAALVKKLGFDGVDINMGCPERGITKRGCCSALIIDVVI